MKLDYQFFTTTPAAWNAMYQALHDARESILWEIYILVDDAVGKRFVDVLCAKAQAGLQVKVILDGVGSWSLSSDALGRLRLSGAQVVWYNQVLPDMRPWRLWQRIFFRNHRKVLVIDGQTAFVGGVNIEAVAAPWDDIHLRITGEMVTGLARGFAKSFIRAGGSRHEVRQLLGKKSRAGIVQLREKIYCLWHSPQDRLRGGALRRWYKQAIASAKESLTLLTPYYAPDRQFISQLRAARRRGVDVQLLVPLCPDVRLIHYIAWACYALTQRAGIGVHFLPTMNHGKALCADGQLGMVGSANITPRSLLFNEEAGIVFSDRSMGRDLQQILSSWKRQSIPWSEVKKRSNRWHDRLLTGAASVLRVFI